MYKIKLMILMVCFCSLSYAQRSTGNGGSGNEAQLAGKQAELVQIAQKIKSFFLKYPERMEKEFPQISIKKLAKKIDKMKIYVSNKELIDRHDKVRSCLNFAWRSYIHCNYSQLQKIRSNPEAMFVLVLHEILGLLRIEETSPQDPTYIEGYKISKAIATYVTRVADYDLRIENTPDEQTNPTPPANKCPYPQGHVKEAFAIIESKQGDVCAYLNQHLIAKDARNERCETLYYSAIRNNSVEALECLERKGYRPQDKEWDYVDWKFDRTFYREKSPFVAEHLVKYANYRTAQYLYQEGIKLTIYDGEKLPINDWKDQNLLLYQSALSGNSEAVQFFIDNKASVNLSRTKYFENQIRPLSAAIESGNLNVIELLIKSGAKIDELYEYYVERSDLMLAVRSPNSSKIVKTLIREGASINKRDKEGWTALMYAAFTCTNNELSRSETYESIVTLVNAGADKTSRTTETYEAIPAGLTAYDIAKKAKCPTKFLEILKP